MIKKIRKGKKNSITTKRVCFAEGFSLFLFWELFREIILDIFIDYYSLVLNADYIYDENRHQCLCITSCNKRQFKNTHGT